MAGKMCPNCGEQTLYEIPSGRKCTRCGYKITRPVNGGIGGKGQKCSLCGKHTLFDGKCRSCGATEHK